MKFVCKPLIYTYTYTYIYVYIYKYMWNKLKFIANTKQYHHLYSYLFTYWYLTICFTFVHFFQVGRIVFAMGKKYLDQDYLRGLEPTMKRHEAAGFWKMTVRKTVPNYEQHEPGLIFVFEVLWRLKCHKIQFLKQAPMLYLIIMFVANRSYWHAHWMPRVGMMQISSSLEAPEVVVTTTWGTASVYTKLVSWWIPFLNTCGIPYQIFTWFRCVLFCDPSMDK